MRWHTSAKPRDLITRTHHLSSPDIEAKAAKRPSIESYCLKMAGTLDPCIPLPLDEALLKEVVGKAKDWAIMHGAAMRSRDRFSEDTLQVIAACCANNLRTPSTTIGAGGDHKQWHFTYFCQFFTFPHFLCVCVCVCVFYRLID